MEGVLQLPTSSDRVLVLDADGAVSLSTYTPSAAARSISRGRAAHIAPNAVQMLIARFPAHRCAASDTDFERLFNNVGPVAWMPNTPTGRYADETVYMFSQCLSLRSDHHSARAVAKPLYRVTDNVGRLDGQQGFNLHGVTMKSDRGVRPGPVRRYTLSRRARRNRMAAMWRNWRAQYGAIMRRPEFCRLTQREQRMILASCDAVARERRPLTPQRVFANYLATGHTGVGPRPGARHRPVPHAAGTPHEVVVQVPVARYDGSPVFAVRIPPSAAVGSVRDIKVRVRLNGRTALWLPVGVVDATEVGARTAAALPPKGVLAMVRGGDVLVLAAPVGAQVCVTFRTPQRARRAIYTVTSQGLESDALGDLSA